MRGHLGAEQSRKQNGHFWRKCDCPYLSQFCMVPPAKICVGKPFKAPFKWYIIHRNRPKGSHARHPAVVPSWWPLPWGRIFRLLSLPYSVAMYKYMHFSKCINIIYILSPTGCPNRALEEEEQGGVEYICPIWTQKSAQKAPRKRQEKRPKSAQIRAQKAPEKAPESAQKSPKKRPDNNPKSAQKRTNMG